MKAINKLFQAIYDASFIKLGNHTPTHVHTHVCAKHTHTCERVCLPKENGNQLRVKNKGNVSINLNKIYNHQCNLKNQSTLQWDQYFDPTENKKMERTLCPLKISLLRPPLLGVGKMISSDLWQLHSFFR